MAQQTLQTIVKLSGQVDNSFSQIGNVLTGLGTQINGISRKLIDFGKESVETYTEYDDAMREVQAVGGYTTAEMERLDKLNREIAQTTTYSNIQSANAMVLIAQAGMDVEETYALLPNVLNMAMAGNLDLADSVDYLLSSVASLGIGVEGAETLVDQMAKTASIGMTDIDTLGESLTRLGSAGGQFFSSSEEILTVLSAMSQFGEDQRGSQAGTWLRNFMLSLAAPTGDVDAMVEAMQELGATEDEIEEYSNSHSSGQAAQAVQSLVDQGLKIYDDQGKLLPAIDIIKSLRDTVYGNSQYSSDLEELSDALEQAGGDIDSFISNTEGLTDNALYSVLVKIFGKRGLSTALNLMSISDEEWDETMSEIVNSDGFAESMSETMQGGLGGALRSLEAAYTEFKTTIGETLAPAVQNVAEGLTSIVTSVSNMDEGTMDALVSGVSVIAAAGPGLLVAGSAFKIIGALMTPATGYAAAAIAIVALGAALDKLDQADFANQFGDLKLESEGLTTYINSLGSSFETAYGNVNSFNTALEKAVTDYTTASTTFKSDLLTNMLTGTTLTDADIASLEALGDTMYNSILNGIDNNYASVMGTVTNAFGGEEEAENDPVWAHIINVLNAGYEGAIAQANSLSQQLRDAMTSAFEDGVLSPEEIENIQGIIDQMNDLMAQQTTIDNYAAESSLLRKAQTMGLDGLQELSEQELERQNSVMEQLYANQDNAYAYTRYQYEQQVSNGEISQEQMDSDLAALKLKQAEEAAMYHTNFIPFTTKLYDTTIGESELGDVWSGLQSFSDSYLASGVVKYDALSAYQNYDLKDRERIAEISDWYIEALGGYDALMNDIEYLQKTEGKTQEQIATDQESANKLLQLIAMNDLSRIGTYGGTPDEDVLRAFQTGDGTYTVADAQAQSAEIGDMADVFWSKVGDAAASGNEVDFMQFMQSGYGSEWLAGIDNIVANLKSTYDFSKFDVPSWASGMSDYYTAYTLMNMSTSVDTGDAADKRAEVEAMFANEIEQGVDVTDNGSAAATRSAIENQFSSSITQNVNVRTSLSSGTGFGAVPKKYAEGGRADTASIFGEAGPEWAIPEEHSERTASLLDAARKASGFTWPELLSRNGGLNAGGGTATQLVYSPTIYANDANGVEARLIEDKARLEKWIRERELRDDVAVYA